MANNNSNKQLETQRHSMAHVMAAAVQQMFPEAQFGVGPAVDNGAYYDFVLPRNLVPEDLKIITKNIKELLKRPLEFKKDVLDMGDAAVMFETMSQPLKVELLQDLAKHGTTRMDEIESFVDDSDLEVSEEVLGQLLAEGLESGRTLVVDAIIEHNGKVFSQKRSADRRTYAGCWDIVGGKVDPGEGLKEALVREVREETGWEVVKLKHYMDYVDHDIRDVEGNGVKEGENPVSRVYRFIVELEGDLDNPVLEEGKVDEARWFSEDELDAINNAPITGDSYIYDTYTEYFKWKNASAKPFDDKPEIIIYRLVDTKTGEEVFTDLCRGPHVEGNDGFKELKKMGWKLDKFSGSYWRGDQERNIQMNRLYLLAFEDNDGLQEYDKMMREAMKRDHRKIGKDMELFAFDEEVGVGLPLWAPKGAMIAELIEKLAKQQEKDYGYDRVRSPHIGKEELYLKSGHLPYYAEDMYPPMEMDNEKYYLKAMNCPHHHKIFDSFSKSYKDLPLRYAEYGHCYRFEDSGSLFGLMRVRSMCMNDAHIYCTEDQFEDEFGSVIQMYLDYFEIFGITKYEMHLSKHSVKGLGKKYVNEPELWKQTEDQVRQALINKEVPFIEVEDEAAFYGPKIDVQVWSAIGREFTLATNQLDFAQPRRFELKYTGQDGESHTPICIHRAPLSTHERLIGFLIEQYAGWFPFWLAPEQVRVLPVTNNNSELNDYVVEIENILKSVVLIKPLKYNEVRHTVDNSDDSLGKKLRNGMKDKVALLVIVGEKDMENKTVTLRMQDDEQEVKLVELEQFMKNL